MGCDSALWGVVQQAPNPPGFGVCTAPFEWGEMTHTHTHTHTLDGRNRARVIAGLLARVITAIRIASARRSYLPPKSQKLVLTDPAFVALRFESRDWRSLVQQSFHMELRNGLRELIAFAER